MEKKLTAATMLAGLLLGATSLANAQQPANPWYVGFGLGSATIDTDVSGTTGTASLDEDDTSRQVFAGFRFTDNFAIEAQYNYFGEATLSGNEEDQFVFDGQTFEFTADNTSVKVSADSYALGLVGMAQVTPQVQFFGKLGLHRWDVDGSGTSDAGNASFSDSGTDIFYAGGAQIRLLDEVAVRLEGSVYDLDDYEVSAIGGSLLFIF